MCASMEAPYRARSRWLAEHVLPHEPSVRAWLRRSTQVSDTDIDDLIQEMYAILAKLENVENIRDPRRYAMQVAKSVFLQGLRRSKVVQIETIADLASLDTPDDAPTPEQHAFGQRELRRVEAAIETMPPQVRKVFWLRRVHGLSQRETAQEMGLAEHTIEKYAARGMKFLLQQFGHGGKSIPDASTDHDLTLVGTETANGRPRTGR